LSDQSYLVVMPHGRRRGRADPAGECRRL